jgi:hypothetical protein
MRSGRLSRSGTNGLLSAACTEVQYKAEAMLLDAMVEALVRFAAEFPEAPRTG